MVVPFLAAGTLCVSCVYKCVLSSKQAIKDKGAVDGILHVLWSTS